MEGRALEPNLISSLKYNHGRMGTICSWTRVYVHCEMVRSSPVSLYSLLPGRAGYPDPPGIRRGSIISTGQSVSAVSDVSSAAGGREACDEPPVYPPHDLFRSSISLSTNSLTMNSTYPDSGYLPRRLLECPCYHRCGRYAFLCTAFTIAHLSPPFIPSCPQHSA